MIRTVDLVVAGGGDVGLAAAAAALERGQRVLILLGASHPGVGQRVRRRLRACAVMRGGHLTIVSNADVVCVDGVAGVEVVVVRDARTGRLSAVNTSTFLPGGEAATGAC